MAFLDNLIDRLMVRFAPGGQYESRALRARFRRVHDIDVGLYSIGAFDRWRLPPGTRVGRYCSIAKTVQLVEADHPVEALTTHPFLYLRRFGLVDRDRVPENRQLIEDDVWVGHNAIILPGCTRIGRGAVIGAGSVVMADVPRYAIFSGAPARLVRYRFTPEVIAAVEATRWWELDKRELARGLREVPDFGKRPSVETADRFLRALGRPGLDRAALAVAAAPPLPKLPAGDIVALFRAERPDFQVADLETPIAELGLDSFALINLRVGLEAMLGRQIHDGAWGNLHRPADLVGEATPDDGLATAAVTAASAAPVPAGSRSLPPPADAAKPGSAPANGRSYRINMPQMALRGLSETWLMKELGDLHWDILMRELRTHSSALADAAGDRLYATFTRIRYRADAPLTDFRENERLSIDMKEARYGAAMFFGTATITGVRARATAELMTTFSKYGEAGANTSLLKGAPVIPSDCAIPALDTMPPFGAEYRALRAAQLPPAIAEIPYELLPAHDINGVGLLYFAAYPAIAELSLTRLKGSWFAFETSLVERDICYFANADPTDRLTVFLHSFDEGSEEITYLASIARVSDGRTMARLSARKRRVALPPPGRPVAVED